MAINNERSESSIENYHVKEKWALQFLIVCVVLAAIIFGLVQAVVYLTSPTRNNSQCHKVRDDEDSRKTDACSPLVREARGARLRGQNA